LIFFGVFYIGYLINVYKYKELRLIISGIMVLFMLTGFMYFKTQEKLILVCRLIDKTCQRMFFDEVDRLRLQDKRQTIIRLALIVWPSFGPIIYAYFGTVDSFIQKFYPSRPVMFATLIAFILNFSIGRWYFHFYHRCLVVGSMYAKHCKVVIENFAKEKTFLVTNNYETYPVHTNPVSYKIIQSTFQEYSKFVREINRLIGLIPLTMFTVMFFDFIVGISFISLNSNTSLNFTILSFGLATVNQIIAVVEIVREATKATNFMNQAALAANTMISKPMKDKYLLRIKETRDCLRYYLTQNPIEQFSVGSITPLEPRVPLIFFNSIIPFTIMIITTILEFIRHGRMEGWKALQRISFSNTSYILTNKIKSR